MRPSRSHIKLLLVAPLVLLLLSIHSVILLDLLLLLSGSLTISLALAVGLTISVPALHLVLQYLLVHGFVVSHTLAVVGSFQLAHIL